MGFQGIIVILSETFAGNFSGDPIANKQKSTIVRYLFCFLPDWLMMNGLQYLMFTVSAALRSNPNLTYD
jgi:hypothetical protein